jgi:hypothetical protein
LVYIGVYAAHIERLLTMFSHISIGMTIPDGGVSVGDMYHEVNSMALVRMEGVVGADGKSELETSGARSIETRGVGVL